MTPQRLAEIIEQAHAIGERKENQIGMEQFPSEWRLMIVRALRLMAKRLR